MRFKEFNHYIDKIQRYPAHILAEKAFRKAVGLVVQKMEKIDAKMSVSNITDQHLLEGLERINSLHELICSLQGERPNFFINASKKQDLINIFAEKIPDTKEAIIAEADKACSHVFNLLGSGDVNLDDFIRLQGGRQKCGYLPWHYDFKTGYSWDPYRFYKEVKIPYGKADIKVPWELSRFQQVITLGQPTGLQKMRNMRNSLLRKYVTG